VPLEYLVAELDAADSRYMKVYSGSAVAVVIPISVVAPLRAVHPAIAVNADFTATPLRAGRAGKQHRGSQGRNGCSK
jgi:hypothetical protein